jgi:hypothetical protein
MVTWYLYRLLPHRPDFAATMTQQETAAMMEHFAYWRGHLDAGRVLVFSPVADPERSWGFAVVSAEPDELADLRAGDPAVKAGYADADFLLLPTPVIAGAAPSAG